MNAKERFLAVMKFQKYDRTLLWEFGYWAQTIQRWYKEGLPKKRGLPPYPDEKFDNTVRAEALPLPLGLESAEDRCFAQDFDVHEYFEFDKGFAKVPVNLGMEPPFKRRILEEDDESVIFIDEWGIKQKVNKNDDVFYPMYLSWPIKDRGDFEKLRQERFQIRIKDRLPENWPFMLEEYRRGDYPLALGHFPYGLYGTLRYLMGEVNLLQTFHDDPKLIKDMMNFLANFWISIWSEVLVQVQVDVVHFWEDMCYNKGSLISPTMFREFMMPCYKKMTKFLKEKGIDIILVDCDGKTNELIPLWIESGVTGLYPFESKAGMNVVEVGKQYPRLQILGGIDKTVLTMNRKKIDQELERKIAFMSKRGGYIPFIDHLVPPDVPWENFKYYRKRLRQMIGEHE